MKRGERIHEIRKYIIQRQGDCQRRCNGYNCAEINSSAKEKKIFDVQRGETRKAVCNARHKAKGKATCKAWGNAGCKTRGKTKGNTVAMRGAGRGAT